MYRWQLDNFFKKVTIRKFLLFVIVCCLGFFYFAPPLHQTNQENEKEQVSRYTPSKPRLEIIGLKYDLNFMGETSLQLKADRFVIRKKKLGLIRFGLAQEAFFENAEVSFFCKKKLPSLHDNSNDNITTPFKLQEANASEPAVNYSLSSLKEMLTSSDTKRLSSVVMAPVSIFFYDEDNKVSHIYAKSASFRIQSKEVVLSGDVRMTAGEKHIKTSKLIFNPDKEEIYIPGNSMLEIQGVEKTGGPITSDVFLNSVLL